MTSKAKSQRKFSLNRAQTEDRTLAVALRDSAGNKLAYDWINDDDWQSIVGLALENVRMAMGV